MNTLVMNLKTGAVSEYDAGLRYGASLALSDAGLHRAHTGELDDAAPIPAGFALPSTTWGADGNLLPRYAYVAGRIDGASEITVTPRGQQGYTYRFTVHHRGRQRAVLGKGLRHNYFDFTFANVEGAAFVIDKFDLDVAESSQRRL